MSNRTLYTVQAARGLAAFMVVAFHMLAIEGKYVFPKLLPAGFVIGQIGVDIFFVISGFVMVMTTAGLQPGRATISNFLRRRLTRIYPIYWLFLSLLLPVYLLAPQLVNSSQDNQVDLVSSFLLLPSDHLPLLAVAWSLVFELWFYLVFAAFLTMPRRALPGLLTIWVVALGTISFMSPNLRSAALKLIVSPYAFEFIAGCAGFYFYKVASKPVARSAVALGLLSLVAMLILWPTVLDSVSVIRSCSLGISIGLVLSGVAALERHGEFARAVHLKWTGDISYAIYLSHVLVLSLLGRGLLTFTHGADLPVFLVLGFWAAAVAGVIASGLFTHYLIELPLIAILSGRRYSVAAASQSVSIASGVIPTAAPKKSNSGSVR